MIDMGQLSSLPLPAHLFMYYLRSVIIIVSQSIEVNELKRLSFVVQKVSDWLPYIGTHTHTHVKEKRQLAIE